MPMTLLFTNPRRGDNWRRVSSFYCVSTFPEYVLFLFIFIIRLVKIVAIE